MYLDAVYLVHLPAYHLILLLEDLGEELSVILVTLILELCQWKLVLESLMALRIVFGISKQLTGIVNPLIMHALHGTSQGWFCSIRIHTHML